MLHNKQFARLLIVSSTLLLTTLIGCGGKPQSTFPVSGVLQWIDGKPATELAGATVELQVIEGVALRVSPHGEVQPDGTFVLRTYEPKDGAPSGKYRAMVMPVLLADPGESMAASPLDARFQSFKSTPLEVNVAPEPNEIVLSVERTKGR